MRFSLGLLAAGVAGLAAAGAHAQTVTFRVCLDGGQVVPPTGSAGTGSASVVLDTATGSVSITGTYSGLGSNRTGVHVHGDAGVGANAGTILTLSGTGGTTGTFGGSSVLSPAQVQSMLNGRNYIDVHSSGFSAGEIRGQVVQLMNEDCPAELPTDPVLADTGGDPDFGPKVGDASEPFNMSLDCSNAGVPGVYSIVIKSGKRSTPVATGAGSLWGSGPTFLRCGGVHFRNTVRCFANDVVLPANLSLVGVSYSVQGYCSDPGNGPGRLSNAIVQVVGIGPSTNVQDTFDGTALDPAWSILHPGLVQYSVSGGELHMQPTMTGGQSIWFADEEGPLIHRSVTGNFIATATVRVEDPNNPGQPPPAGNRFGGLLARDPASVSGDRNSVHVALGAGSSSGAVAEDKSTDGSNSVFTFTSVPQPRGEVRIVRTGSLFSLEYRAPGAPSFQVLSTHDRPDLPATLQVGVMVYSLAAPADILEHVDDVTIVHF